MAKQKKKGSKTFGNVETGGGDFAGDDLSKTEVTGEGNQVAAAHDYRYVYYVLGVAVVVTVLVLADMFGIISLSSVLDALR